MLTGKTDRLGAAPAVPLRRRVRGTSSRPGYVCWLLRSRPVTTGTAHGAWSATLVPAVALDRTAACCVPARPRSGVRPGLTDDVRSRASPAQRSAPTSARRSAELDAQVSASIRSRTSSCRASLALMVITGLFNIPTRCCLASSAASRPSAKAPIASDLPAHQAFLPAFVPDLEQVVQTNPASRTMSMSTAAAGSCCLGLTPRTSGAPARRSSRRCGRLRVQPAFHPGLSRPTRRMPSK